MRAVVQRVAWARVSVDGAVVGSIDGPGLCVLVGVRRGDSAAAARKLAAKLWGLRIFDGEVSVGEVGGRVLVVSQFTLYGDVSRGRRPSWIEAAPPEEAEPLIEEVVAALRDLGAEVATGRFRAEMVVELANDGPVTLVVDVPGNQ
ncbi:MAG TPA: D-aminoacyl-tRNA deacylase [Acidimicrobiales bacterium]|nr:D-aminoacyl-tRNA deacylase [Acidimicrobiales bacterium]